MLVVLHGSEDISTANAIKLPENISPANAVQTLGSMTKNISAANRVKMTQNITTANRVKRSNSTLMNKNMIKPHGKKWWNVVPNFHFHFQTLKNIG